MGCCSSKEEPLTPTSVHLDILQAAEADVAASIAAAAKAEAAEETEHAVAQARGHPPDDQRPPGSCQKSATSPQKPPEVASGRQGRRSRAQGRWCTAGPAATGAAPEPISP